MLPLLVLVLVLVLLLVLLVQLHVVLSFLVVLLQTIFITRLFLCAVPVRIRMLRVCDQLGHGKIADTKVALFVRNDGKARPALLEKRKGGGGENHDF